MSFELILVVLVVITGLLVLLDRLFFAPERKIIYGKAFPSHANDKTVHVPWILEYAHAFFPLLLLVLVIRSFLVEPFRIPTGSLKPTLLDGDFVLVNKFAYGLRLPLLHTQILPIGEPKRGDIIVFRWPVNTKVDYIKRVVGMPGDHIRYLNKTLYINGKPIKQTFKSYVNNTALKIENLDTVTHAIYQSNKVKAKNFSDIEVPPGNYFVMGDNRDDSQDSREWGFVPEKNVVGRAFMVWFSWDSDTYRVRWNRIGLSIE